MYEQNTLNLNEFLASLGLTEAYPEYETACVYAGHAGADITFSRIRIAAAIQNLALRLGALFTSPFSLESQLDALEGDISALKDAFKDAKLAGDGFSDVEPTPLYGPGQASQLQSDVAGIVGQIANGLGIGQRDLLRVMGAVEKGVFLRGAPVERVALLEALYSSYTPSSQRQAGR